MIGFNWGQMFHYITLQHGKQTGLPPKIVDEILAVTPRDLLDNVRFSGTMSNYMNLHEPGYGTHDNTITLWQQLANKRLSLTQRLVFSKDLLLKNRANIFKALSSQVDQSYLYNCVEAYRQLGCKTMAFTFNSHMPYLGHCTLEQSIESLRFIRDNTNLISVELENETYLADYIIGDQGSFENNINRFLDYIESKVVPAVVTVVGRQMPLGLSICAENSPKFRYWNKAVIRLARRLKSKGLEIFLTPHVYAEGYSRQEIVKELVKQTQANFREDFQLRVTEFNVLPESGNCNQEEVKQFINDFEAETKLNPFITPAIYYHSLYTVRGAHFSFVK